MVLTSAKLPEVARYGVIEEKQEERDKQETRKKRGEGEKVEEKTTKCAGLEPFPIWTGRRICHAVRAGRPF